jgi:hypothetical protein
MGAEFYEIRNLRTAPASDDLIVDGLIAFANGAELSIVGQPSRGEPRSKSADRPTYVEFLDDMTGARKGILPMLTDEGGRQRPVVAVMDLKRGKSSLLPKPIRSLASVSVNRIVVGRPQGYSLAYYRQFNTVGAALAEAAMLIADPYKPYRASLRRCQYPACQKFYFARKNPRGGPANDTYCVPEHRRLHNNSALRKQT